MVDPAARWLRVLQLVLAALPVQLAPSFRHIREVRGVLVALLRPGVRLARQGLVRQLHLLHRQAPPAQLDLLVQQVRLDQYFQLDRLVLMAR